MGQRFDFLSLTAARWPPSLSPSSPWRLSRLFPCNYFITSDLLTIPPARRVEPLRCAAFEPLCRTDRPSGSWGWGWGLLAEAQKSRLRVGIADRKVFARFESFYVLPWNLSWTDIQTGSKVSGNYKLSLYCLESFWPSSKSFLIGLKISDNV